MTNVVKLQQPAPDSFEAFWQAYPRRDKGKKAARALWEKIIRPGGVTTRTKIKDSDTYVQVHLQATPQEIIAGAKRYYQANRLNGTGQYGFKDEGRYLQHATTWLNQGGWEND